METELSCSYDSRASFYGKARVRTEDDKIILCSYSTDVAYIKNAVAVVNGSYSNTTLRHIKEFLKQNSFEADTSKQILKDYSPTKKQIEKENKLEEEKSKSMFKSVGLVASMGEVFCDNKKDKNDWKLRMLKAGVVGLSVPEDWDTLTELEKETRLNGVIKIVNE